MKRFYFLTAIVVIVLSFVSCSKKGEIVEITGLTEYKDQATGFAIKHPSNWTVQSIPGSRLLVFSTAEAKDRFIGYDPKGIAGAKIEILITKLDTGKTFEKLIQTKKFDPTLAKYTAPEKVTIDGVQGTKETYTFELEDGVFNGEIFYATKDSNYAATIIFESFAGTFPEYKKKFDEILATIKLPVKPEEKPAGEVKPKEADPPSKNMISKGGDGYSIDIPDNFRAEGSRAAGTLSSRNYIGDRRADCNIQIDVLDASKQSNLKKIVDENSPKYKNASPQETSIGGQKSYVMSYTFGRNVMSKVYFVVKGNKLYRITMNWFKGEEADYLPIFEKSIKSIKFQ